MELKETVEVTTPVKGVKVVLRGYVTGHIKQAIEAALFNDADISPGADGQSFKGSALIASKNKAIELMVVSVDGSTSNVLEAVLNLPADDYEFVKTKIDEVSRPLVEPNSTS